MQTSVHFVFFCFCFLFQLPKMVLNHLLLEYVMPRRDCPPVSQIWTVDKSQTIAPSLLHWLPLASKCHSSGNSSLGSNQLKKGFVYWFTKCQLHSLCIFLHIISPPIFISKKLTEARCSFYLILHNIVYSTQICLPISSLANN